MSVFILRLSAASGASRFFCGDRNTDAGIIEVRIVIPPPVVILFRDFSGFQLSGLLLPCAKPLIQIGSVHATVKNLCAETDQTIRIRDTKQLAILQCEKRVHQSVHGIDIRHSDRLWENDDE